MINQLLLLSILGTVSTLICMEESILKRENFSTEKPVPILSVNIPTQVVNAPTRVKKVKKALLIDCADNQRLAFKDDEFPPTLRNFIRKIKKFDKPSNIIHIQFQNPHNPTISLDSSTLQILFNQKIANNSWSKKKALNVLDTAQYLQVPEGYLILLADAIRNRFVFELNYYECEFDCKNYKKLKLALHKYQKIPALPINISYSGDKITLQNSTTQKKQAAFSLSSLTNIIRERPIRIINITQIILDNIALYAILPDQMQCILEQCRNLKYLQMSNTKLVTIEPETFNTPPDECIINLSDNKHLKNLPQFPYTWNNGILIIQSCPLLTAESKANVICTFPLVYTLFPYLKPAGFQTITGYTHQNTPL